MILIKNINVVNEDSIYETDVLIEKDVIKKIDKNIETKTKIGLEIIEAKGKYLLPGIIDSHVHFRQPGLCEKGDIEHETRAAAAGGITSFMEMPNTIPQTTNIKELEKKYEIAAQKSLINYSFYIGATNNNFDEIKKIDFSEVCGVKIFLGASTGNILVENKNTIEKIFSQIKTIIAIHSEDEKIIMENYRRIKEQYNGQIPIEEHPNIRSVEACFKTTDFAIKLAQKYNTHLNVLHLSTAKELDFFEVKELKKKHITAEVCPHYLLFDSKDYIKFGSKIKCNPAIKDIENKKALFEALINDKIDTISTDHAPHQESSKTDKYTSPSGIPTIQYSLNIMLEFYRDGKIGLEKIVEKMCHNPAKIYKIKQRGFIKEGYKADLCILNLNEKTKVNKENILYKCAWSPFENKTFNSKIEATFVNGNLVFNNGKFNDKIKGQRLYFDSFEHVETQV